jgi:hypothetical protein
LTLGYESGGVKDVQDLTREVEELEEENGNEAFRKD